MKIICCAPERVVGLGLDIQSVCISLKMVRHLLRRTLKFWRNLVFQTKKSTLQLGLNLNLLKIKLLINTNIFLIKIQDYKYDIFF